mgnify:FL=1|tara:strand:+ start:57 stop:1115 length:1059 start_codon:yes stop_codon:yes gene_type:complete
MATTTPNYGWSVPTSSDLVKNGATDIETLGDSVDASLWSSGYGQAGKNKLVNGDCSIAQRGTSFTATGYSLDRWRAAITGTTTVSQETSDLPTNPYFRYGIKFVTGAAASFSQFQQALETTTVVGLRGLSVTISGYVKITGGYTGNWLVQKFYSTSTDTLVSQTTQIGSNVTIATSATSTWTRFSDTFTVPTDANGLMIQFAPNTAQASGVTVRMTGMQLEVGSKATPFQTASGGSPQAELAMCQRYYYRFTPTATTRYGSALADSTTTALVLFVYPVTMRAIPTALEQSGVAADYSLAGVATTVCSIVPVFSSANVANGNVGFTVASGLVAGQALQGRLLTGAYLGWSAEL